MISLFGDLARDEGQVIEGPVLSALMAAMDVRPEAARVALHRLRKDNWIASQKQGRISEHRLTPEGRAQSQAASARIYADTDDLPQEWQLLLIEEAQTNRALKAGFVPLQPRVFVGAATLKPPKNALALPGDKVPDWIKRQLEPEDLSTEYANLESALREAMRLMPSRQALDALDIAVLRCLVVHNWRRLALKHAPLPRPLMRDDWPGLTCHMLVADILGTFSRPDMAELAVV